MNMLLSRSKWVGKTCNIVHALDIGYLLTHYGLVMPYDDIDLDNIASCNGLLSDGTKPIPEPMLTPH